MPQDPRLVPSSAPIAAAQFAMVRKGLPTTVEQADVSSLIKDYGRPSFAATRKQEREIDQVAVHLYQSMQMRCREFLADRLSEPMVQFYSNDETPMKLRMQGAWKVGEQTYRRAGKAGRPFLIQMSFYRTVGADDSAESVCSWEPPLLLSHGKSAAAVHAATMQRHRTLRQQGHRGLVIQFYSFDRALFEPLSRLLQQEHMLAAPQYGKSKAQSELLHHHEWTVTAGCALHDAHNSLKWGLNFQAWGPQLLKDLFIVMQSLKNSFNLVTERLTPWLALRLIFTDREECPPGHELLDLWTAMGVDPVLAEQLASDMALHWDFELGALRVAADFRETKEAFEEIAGALMGIWNFRPFSDSRWVTVGLSCRSLVAGLMTGLPSLVEDIREHCADKLTYIEGYQRLQGDVLKFAICASLASYVADAGLAAVFEDSRVAKSHMAIREAMVSEVQWLQTTSDSLWRSLCHIFRPSDEMTPYRLRSEVLTSAHTSFAFFDYRVLQEVDKYPWCIAIGDQQANLEALAGAPQPEEPTAKKIWTLVQAGISRETICAGLKLLLELPWATGVTEQAHAMAAVVKRLHPEMQEHSLLSRSFIGGFRKLLPSPSVEHRQVAKLQRQLGYLEAKNPLKSGARQEFFGDLARLNSEMERSNKASRSSSRLKRIMENHSQLFARLSPMQRKAYELASAAAIAESMDALQNEIANKRSQLMLANMRLQQSRSERPCLSLGACKLSAGELDSLNQQWRLCDMAAAQAQKIVRSWGHAPEPITAHRMEELGECTVFERSHLKNPSATKPSWLGRVCSNRQQFARTIWTVFIGEDMFFYRFLFAKKSPHYIVFEPLQELSDMEGVVDDLAPAGVSVGDHDSFYLSDAGIFKDWSQMGLAQAELVTVSRYAVSVGDFVVFCSDAPTSIADFLASLPEEGGKEETEAPAKKKPKIDTAGITAEMLEQFPWMADHMKAPRARRGGAAASAGPMDDAAEDAVDVLDEFVGEEIDDDDLERLYKALEAKRAEWDIHTSEVFADGIFKVMILKGKACLELTGLDYDAVRAYASGTFAKRWCGKYHLQVAKRFNVLLYEEENAFTLAKAWCSKMAHFYTVYMDQDDEDYEFTDADCESWAMPVEYRELLPKFTAKQAKEGRSIVHMRPRL